MADEIADQNRIAVWRRPDGTWTARLGPAGLGLTAGGFSPQHALSALKDMVKTSAYLFDPTWKPAE